MASTHRAIEPENQAGEQLTDQALDIAPQYDNTVGAANHYDDDDDSFDSEDIDLDDLEDELNDFDGWDNATGDFTKQYNRLRQQLQPNKSTNPVISTPAANQPRKTSVVAKKTESSHSIENDPHKQGDQIDALQTKFEGRLHLGEHSVAPPVAELKLGSKKAAGDR
ncbi:hypothetical protein BX616_004135, partial [Lobosporangium transversale]